MSSDRLRHWVHFGRRGQPPIRRATSGDWTTKSFEYPLDIPWDLPVPRKELDKVLSGFLPTQMEDKWFVYTVGPDAHGMATVHFHRSWTGNKVAELLLEIDLLEDGKFSDKDARFTSMKWEANPEFIKDMSGDSAKAGIKEVLKWCLGVQL